MRVLIILFELLIGFCPPDRSGIVLNSAGLRADEFTTQSSYSLAKQAVDQLRIRGQLHWKRSQKEPVLAVGMLWKKHLSIAKTGSGILINHWIKNTSQQSVNPFLFAIKTIPVEPDPQMEEKEREIASLQKASRSQSEDLRKQTLLRNFFIVGLILVMIIAITVTKRYKLKRQSEQHFIHQNIELQLANKEILQHQENIMLQNKQLQQQASEIQLINESLIEKNNQLEELNAEINSLMHIVAHDLQSPLNRVSGLSQLISIEGTLNENQQHYLELIQKTALEGSRLIRDLLDINAIEQQSTVINWEEVNLSEFFPLLLADYQQAAQRKHIQLHYQDSTQGVVLETDQRYLSRIMDNLLSNAIKFSHFERNIFVRLTEDERTIRIAVQDQGQGLSASDQTKLFRKFQKLSAQPTGGESSTGLGMWIIKTLVETLNGQIQVESELHKGSMFTISFRKAQQIKSLTSIANQIHSRAV